MNKYGIIIYWSEEDQVFIAGVPELAGCMTHGDTQAKALANAKEAIKAWIDTANEFGDTIPQPKGEDFLNKAKRARKASKSSGKKRHVAKSKPASERK